MKNHASTAPTQTADVVPAVFIDRDGVINFDHGYVHRIVDFHFVPGVFEMLRGFQDLGFLNIVVTNQSGIGRGFFSKVAFDELTQWMMRILEEQGIQLDGVYHCPHAPNAGCTCRKPLPGMILQATVDHSIDLTKSWLVGDQERDIQAAIAAEVPATILLRASDARDRTKASYTCGSSLSALDVIRTNHRSEAS